MKERHHGHLTVRPAMDSVSVVTWAGVVVLAATFWVSVLGALG